MSEASDRIVVDVDSHWAEPPELWVSRAPARFKDRVPKLVDDGTRDAWVVDGTVMSGFCFSVIDKTGDKLYAKTTIERFADSDPSASYAEPRLAKMDEMGLSGQVIYPNAIGFGAVDLLAGVKDGELLNVCASIYNEAMADLQRDGKGRLFPQGIIPFWDLEESVRTVERVKDLGLHGIVMCDSPETCGVDAPPLHTDYWNPMWEALEDAELPVSFHVGSGKGRMRAATCCWDNFDTAQFMTLMPAELFMSNSTTIGNILISGMLERFPRLQMFSVESGVGYLPFYLQALDWQYVEGGLDQTRTLSMPPSEYFKRQMYGSFWFETHGLNDAIDYLGDDRVMFETDFPHPSCLYPDLRARIQFLSETLTPGRGEKVMYQNAKRLFKLPDLQPIKPRAEVTSAAS